MVEPTILKIIQDYLQAVNQAGIQAQQGVLFGSWARGEARPESDIDLVVITPQFDQPNRQLINRLWELRLATSDTWRIEPIACGERQWQDDDSSLILEMARREGQMIQAEMKINTVVV